MKQKIKWGRMFVFVCIGIILFFWIQAIICPKWRYPDSTEGTAATIKGLYELEENEEQVLFLGTSHSVYGISPMEIYEKNNIVSYNLGTSAQQVEMSYYLLAEAFKTQKPQVVALDVSGLFFEESSDVAWRYVLDTMPLSRNKVEFAITYAEKNEEEGGTVLSALFPIYRYHDRWDELKENDFQIIDDSDGYYAKGYSVHAQSSPGAYSVETMNEEMDEMKNNEEEYARIYDHGNQTEEAWETSLYNPVINENNVQWLLKIKELCEEHGSQLLLIKVPSVSGPAVYSSAWTEERAGKVRALADTYDMPYLDLVYDTDIHIDWETDSVDAGGHLNYHGAKKVSDYLGEYLESEYEISGYDNGEYDRDLKNYQKVKNVVSLQEETNFKRYLKKLQEEDNITVFIAVKDDMAWRLSNAEKNCLREIGLQSDFSTDKIRYSFLAVLDNNQVIYEASSKEGLTYEYTLEDGTEVQIVSCGFYTSSDSSILIENQEYSLNNRGFNIVVYDKEAGQVIDSVTFDTNAGGDDMTSRDDGCTEQYLREYELYIMEQK